MDYEMSKDISFYSNFDGEVGIYAKRLGMRWK